MSIELFEKISQDILELAQYIVQLERNRDELLDRAAGMIQELKDANDSLMERINEMAEETAEIESEVLDTPRGLAGLKMLADGKIDWAELHREPGDVETGGRHTAMSERKIQTDEEWKA